jgi:hypothetical protein
LVSRIPARSNRGQHVDRLVFANDDVVAACIDRITLMNEEPPFALTALNLQAADDPVSMQEPVMQSVLCRDV